MDARYVAIGEALRHAGTSGLSLCAPLREGFAMSGGGLATLGDPFDVRLVCSSGHSASVLGELQLDLGEGPSWDAVASGKPVLVPDLADDRRWPALTSALCGVGVRSVFAFPLVLGPLTVGALCLDSDGPRELGHGDVQAVENFGPLIANEIVRRAAATGDERGADDGSYSLREVHQATGMVTAQLKIPTDDALVAIRAHAFSSGRSVRDVASDIVARKIDFSRDGV